jgi:hypothetical protein
MFIIKGTVESDVLPAKSTKALLGYSCYRKYFLKN